MAMTWRRWLIAIAALCTLSAARGQEKEKALPFPPAELLNRITPAGIRANMDYLADDLLEGRGTATRGYDLAALYVRSRFEALGLKPAGTGGDYFQPVPLRRLTIVPQGTTLEIMHPGKLERLALFGDFITSGNSLSTYSSSEGPLAFVGYGVSAPEFEYDDFATVDVRGKIVVELFGAPSTFPSAPRAYYSDGYVKAKIAAARGAIGLISVWAGPMSQRIPFERLVRFYQEPQLRWLDAAGVPNEAVPEIRTSAMVSEKGAAILFQGARRTLKQALDDAAQSKPQGFSLVGDAAIHLTTRFTPVESPNVAAILPGSDAALKNEYVVFSAHLDHLGIGEPIRGDVIYNGALDNASGVSAMLEIARAFSEMPTPPRRSILFLAVTGEEAGLLGSDYFAHVPTVPISKIVADINMDGIALLYDFRDVVGLGAEHSSLSREVADVARRMNLEVSPDPMPEEVYFVRSDQYSFVKQGVPAVFLSEGFKTVDPSLNGKSISLEWESTIYHTPQDDMKQKLNFEAGAKFARVDLAIGYEVAEETERPHWNADDFFLNKFGKR
jgi:Zn-dependent M28 family amino/carboxypeptidase